MDVLKFIGIGLAIFLGIIVFAILMALLGTIPNRIAGHTKYGATGLPVDYSIMGGCRIQDKGAWVPVENWRVM